jgi:LysM repeat protein
MNILCIPIIIFLNFSNSLNPILKDTTKVIQKGTYSIVNHTVKPKETLYSLLKKYNITLAEFYKLNPLVQKNTALKIGQILKFKSVLKSTNTVKTFPNKVTKNPTKVVSAVKQPSKSVIVKLDPQKVKNHIVKGKETVFSISKLYGISVAELTEFNNLEENLIYIGQTLILIKELKNDEEDEKDETPKVIPTGKVIKEKGIASVVVIGRPSSKLLALHRTANIGSWITVKNEATGAVVQAKVIGNMSEKGIDEEILVKLSPAAYYKLKPKDSKLRAEVVYYE